MEWDDSGHHDPNPDVKTRKASLTEQFTFAEWRTGSMLSAHIIDLLRCDHPEAPLVIMDHPRLRTVTICDS
jgi:hypothetical protein